jgi:hypothetical protein
MGVGAASIGCVRLARKMQIVRVLALPGDEADVLNAPDRLTDAEFHSLEPRHGRGASVAKRDPATHAA